MTHCPRGAADMFGWGQVLWISCLNPASFVRRSSTYLRNRILIQFWYWTQTVCLHILTLDLSALSTATIGAAQDANSTGSRIPSCVNRWSSSSTFTVMVYGTDHALQSLGAAWGSTTLCASNPWNVPNSTWNTELYLSRSSCRWISSNPGPSAAASFSWRGWVHYPWQLLRICELATACSPHSHPHYQLQVWARRPIDI